MSEQQLYPVTSQAGRDALIDERQYHAMYRYSIERRDAFWAEQAHRIDWIKPFTEVADISFAQRDLHISWYRDGLLNVAANCLDRHLVARGDTTAIIWEPDNPDESHRLLSYRELHNEVCRFANGLRQLGVAKSDVVTIYMPQIPEAVVAMLACARIGALHSVVFAGFSAEALGDRIEDSKSRWVITADHALSAGRQMPMKQNVDAAIAGCGSASIEHVVVVERSGAAIAWQDGRDIWYQQLLSGQPLHCEPEVMAAEDPLFILYTSGCGSKPRGLVHTCGGYLVYASVTHQYVFDYQPGDIYWCTADIARVTGHSYVVYGPLANGATTVMYEGVPDYPDASRWSQIVDKYKVSILVAAPSAMRSLMVHDSDVFAGADLSSLRLLGSVGEAIEADMWHWFHQGFGGGKCPIVDTWCQTETGGIMIAPLPGATALKPGSATLPFFGVEPELMDAGGQLLVGEGQGKLVLRHSWPGQARTIYGDHQRFYDNYFAVFPGYYFSGDGARRDRDGYYWITGRVDPAPHSAGIPIGKTT